jgi:pimeloyl-ACP methyl ester carboxylesterase
MPYVRSIGIRLWHRRAGAGEPVVHIMGSGAAGHVRDMHQAPAPRHAGYQSVILDNRGIPPSDVPAGRYSLAELVGDTRGPTASPGRRGDGRHSER